MKKRTVSIITIIIIILIIKISTVSAGGLMPINLIDDDYPDTGSIIPITLNKYV